MLPESGNRGVVLTNPGSVAIAHWHANVQNTEMMAINPGRENPDCV
jgi:hypothetical protein